MSNSSPDGFHSFGGWKSSIFGDHAMHGMEGVRFYTRIKQQHGWPTEPPKPRIQNANPWLINKFLSVRDVLN